MAAPQSFTTTGKPIAAAARAASSAPVAIRSRAIGTP